MKKSFTICAESEVRSYSRSYPATFSIARDCHLFSDSGDKYIDFLSGCGSLNYGHNNPILKKHCFIIWKMMD